MTRPAAILPALALALAGCSATVSAGKPAADQAAQQAAADLARAGADLAAVQAFSATLATQGAQVTRLVDATLAQAAAAQTLAAVLALALAALALAALAAVAVVALAGRRASAQPPPVYVVSAPAAPQIGAPAGCMILDDPDQWPELRARRRALALAAPRREVNTNA